MLENAYAIALAVETTTGRVSDGVLSAYIPLLEVLPHWQGKGIGTRLIEMLCEQLDDLYMIDLVCDPKLEAFYSPHLFVGEQASHVGVAVNPTKVFQDELSKVSEHCQLRLWRGTRHASQNALFRYSLLQMSTTTLVRTPTCFSQSVTDTATTTQVGASVGPAETAAIGAPLRVFLILCTRNALLRLQLTSVLFCSAVSPVHQLDRRHGPGKTPESRLVRQLRSR